MSQARRAARCVLLGVGLAALLAPGCITPPAILPAGSKTMPSTFALPDRAEVIELTVLPGIQLRGFFVPADEGAPVVLHFLESGGSIGPQGVMWNTATGSAGAFSLERPVFAGLADLGFASLVVDYEGVGASDGERSPRHLDRDARVAWAEAVRRAGGRADRVVVRGISIGTLATACLLESGAQPAGIVAASPVLSDTVTWNFGRAVYGGFLTALVVPFYEDVTEADLDTALLAHPVPHLIWVLAGDELLTDDDLQRLRAAAHATGGRIQLEPGFQEHREMPDVLGLPRHVRGALAARNLLPAERAFLESLFPALPPAARRIAEGRAALPAALLGRFPPGSPQADALDRRLTTRFGDDPELVAWTALTGLEDEAADRLLDSGRDILALWRAEMSDKALSRRLDMTDPLDAALSAAGEPRREPATGMMPLAPMLGLASKLRHYDRLATPMSVDELLDVVAGCAAPGVTSALWKPDLVMPDGSPFTMRYDLRAELWGPVRRDGAVAPELAARRALRLVFKAADFEERAVTGAEGEPLVEVKEGGSWRTVDPRILLEPRGGLRGSQVRQAD